MSDEKQDSNPDEFPNYDKVDSTKVVESPDGYDDTIADHESEPAHTECA